MPTDGMDAAAVPVPDTGDDTLRRVRRAIIAAHDAECACGDIPGDDSQWTLTDRERAIVEAWRADVERLDRYQRLDVIHMQDQLRMIQAVGEALGVDQNDPDSCVPGCDEGAEGLEHDLHHLIERDAARGAAIQRVRAIADNWYGGPCISGYRIPNDDDSESECLHCAADAIVCALDGQETDRG